VSAVIDAGADPIITMKTAAIISEKVRYSRATRIGVRLVDHFFLFGTLAPFFRASLRPIAIACFRLRTFRPDPLFSVPFFLRRIADSTRLPAAFPYLAIRELVCKGRAQPGQTARDVPNCPASAKPVIKPVQVWILADAVVPSYTRMRE
jgi:hypothetical protein